MSAAAVVKEEEYRTQNFPDFPTKIARYFNLVTQTQIKSSTRGASAYQLSVGVNIMLVHPGSLSAFVMYVSPSN